MPYALCPMPYALCPMPYALCPMPYALCPMHVGYLMLLRKAILPKGHYCQILNYINLNLLV